MAAGRWLLMMLLMTVVLCADSGKLQFPLYSQTIFFTTHAVQKLRKLQMVIIVVNDEYGMMKPPSSGRYCYTHVHFFSHVISVMYYKTLKKDKNHTTTINRKIQTSIRKGLH